MWSYLTLKACEINHTETRNHPCGFYPPFFPTWNQRFSSTAWSRDESPGTDLKTCSRLDPLPVPRCSWQVRACGIITSLLPSCRPVWVARHGSSGSSGFWCWWWLLSMLVVWVFDSFCGFLCWGCYGGLLLSLTWLFPIRKWWIFSACAAGFRTGSPGRSWSVGVAQLGRLGSGVLL